MSGGSVIDRQRLLILVIAYEAEATLTAVLDRIPRSVVDAFDCQVLVVDDASEDDTFRLGQRYASENPDLPVRILRNRVNQGYGGNQKVGYTYAIDYEFDLVAMIHGDGQYAPEHLPELLAPFDDPSVGAVFGSRMMVRGAARDGGMPLYKFVGNRVLTALQNWLLGRHFSEFHSGYRVYRVETLEGVHYRLNSNDFHFDTEIILQILNSPWHILERPIRTYYGDEISRVNGIAYAANVMKVTLQFYFHRLGLRQQRRFDPSDGGTPYREKLGYASSHQWAVDAVPNGARVFDIGGGPGHVTEALVDRGCSVTCIDRSYPHELPDGVDVAVADLSSEFTIDVTAATHILLLDVIEHLKDPEGFLDTLRAQFDHRPRRIILSTGNVAFFGTRLGLLVGQFNYGASGILDRDHSRLFTFRTLRHLLRDAGFRIHRVRGVPAPFPLAIGDNWLSRLLLRFNLLGIRISKSLFSFQIFVEADTTPDLDFLVRDAVDHASERATPSQARREPARGDRSPLRSERPSKT